MAGRPDPNPDDSHDSRGSHEPSPLDELFIVGAQYHEPSAAERARAARDAEQRAARERKARARRVKHTRHVLEGGTSSAFDHRTALIGLGAIVVVATLLAETGIWH